MSPFGPPILVAGPPRTATSWVAKTLSKGGWIRYAREPVFQGAPRGYDPSMDNLYLTASDTHAALESAWRDVLGLRSRLFKRWLYSESEWLVRRLPILPA